MPNTVALVLTFDEATALFEAASLGLTRKEELGMPVYEKALDALMRVGEGMGFSPTVVDGTVRLLPPMDH